MGKEVEQIIKELNLDEIKTKKFIKDCFKTGELKTIVEISMRYYQRYQDLIKIMMEIIDMKLN